MQFSEAITRRVEDAFARNMALYPTQREEVLRYCAALTADRRTCLKFLYSCIHVNDLVSYPVSLFDGYVRASLAAYEAIDYAKTVPEELFLTFVLPARINNENLDGSRARLMQELLPRIDGKTMAEAALEVNYWCYEHGTYIPTDNRTVCPDTFRKAALGRCGEESVFLVSALRAVGLPARQVYVPRWSHCDDNHAWVEVWADGAWYYLGACEPEPVLNKGWFTAAASRAMLVAARSDGCLLDKGVTAQMPLRALVNATGTYGECAELNVLVTKHGAPVEGAEVLFQLVNYSELFSVHSAKTDEAGRTSLMLGRGDVMVQIWHDGVFMTQKADLRETTALHFRLEEGSAVEAMDGQEEAFDLTPPQERPLPEQSAAELAAHEARLRRCERVRRAYTRSFADAPDVLSAACGNEAELSAFLATPEFDDAQKAELLSTLRPKDLLDASCEMLRDCLAAALPYRGRFDDEIYRRDILCSRISDEMLVPQRSAIRAVFPQGFVSGREVLDTLRERLTLKPEYGMRNFFATAVGSLRCGMTSPRSFGVVFATVCRCFGIPARRNDLTGEVEWLEGGRWLSIETSTPGETPQSFRLTLHTESPLHYEEQFTVGRFEDGRFVSLGLGDYTLDGTDTLELPAGMYRIMTNTRQIDGTASAWMYYVNLSCDRVVTLQCQPDKTRSALHAVATDFLPDGSAKRWLAQSAGVKRVLLWAEPGKEPTEHLLQELLAVSDACRDCRVGILLAPDAEANNATLQTVLREPWAELLGGDAAALPALRRALGVGDERLPFAAAISARGTGLFAFANYNIHTAQRLLSILHIAEEDDR